MLTTERVIWGCFFVIVNIASLLGNSVVIYVILKKNRSRKFAFLLLLIISDFVVATTMMPLYVVNLLVENVFENSNHICILKGIILTISPMFSYLCITTLAVERYIMVKYPIKHRLCFNKFNTSGIIIAVLIISTISVPINLLRSKQIGMVEKTDTGYRIDGYRIDGYRIDGYRIDGYRIDR